MNIGVIGTGSWRTTLANLLAKKGYSVTLWVYEADLAERMAKNRINDLYLDGFTLAPNLMFTHQLQEAVAGRQLLLLVSPSQVMRHVLKQLQPHLDETCLLVSAAKGIENNTLQLMSEVLEAELGTEVKSRCAFLSGPSFAKEVAQEQPTAVAVAADNLEVAHRVQEIFSTDYFRVYTNQDVIGVEIGGIHRVLRHGRRGHQDHQGKATHGSTCPRRGP